MGLAPQVGYENVAPPYIKHMPALALNALLVILVTELGIITRDREFLLNALSPIVISELGKAMLVRAQD